MFHIALEAEEGLDCRPPARSAARCARRLALGRWYFLSLVKTVSTRTNPQVFLDASVTRRSDEFRVVGTAACFRGSEKGPCAMLRITVHQNPESCTFQLEGRLAGAWVREVEECRRRILAGHRRPSVRFDLTDVTFIDADGRAYLAAMHRQGAAVCCCRLPDKRHRGPDYQRPHSRPQAVRARGGSEPRLN